MRHIIEMETPFLFIGDISLGLGDYIYDEAIESARGAILKHKGEPCGIRTLSYSDSVFGDKVYRLDSSIFGVVDLSLNLELSSSRIKELKKEGTIIRVPSKRCEVTLIERESSIYISVKDLDSMNIIYVSTFTDNNADDKSDDDNHIDLRNSFYDIEGEDDEYDSYYDYYVEYDFEL